MEAPRGLVVEQLTSVRHRNGFEELSGLASGRPVSVAITDAGLLAPDASAAFEAHVRRCLRLAHPAVLRTLAVEPHEPGRWAVLWERVDGPTLDRVLAEKGPMLPEESVAIALALAQALAQAHASGVVHGSLGAEWVTLLAGHDVRVGGFGLGLLGALAAGRRPTERDDVEALGALLHQLLTGHQPTGKLGALPDPALHLGGVLAKALGYGLSDRFRTMAEFAQALGEANRTRVSGGHVVNAASRPPTPVAVRTLGPWALEKLLGEGAMGQVFLARHTMLGRQAAIKVLRPEQYQREDLIQRFFQEARSVNQINHEHIVEISDFGQELGSTGKPIAVYFVMELLQGETLTARLAKGPLSLERALHVIKQLASALAAAHRLGVVHRDVKTDNVFLITRHGDSEYVKVLDFGVAKLTQATPDAPTVSTMDGAIIGTPTSMSPEQASGSAVDRRADVYAVGVLLYLLLSGRLPIDADSFGKLVALLLTKVPDPLPAQTPKGEPIPPALAALVMRCLEKDPAKRPQSMEELLAELSAPELLSMRAPKSARRGAVLGLVVALVAVAGAGAAWWATREPAVAPPVVAPPPNITAPAPEVDAGSAVAVLEPVVVDAGAAEPEVEAEDAGLVAEPVDAGAPKPATPKPQKPVSLEKELTLLKAATERARPKFLACIARTPTLLADKPEGQVPLRFTLKPSGELADVAVQDERIKNPLRACLEGVLAAIRLPPHTGPQRTLSYAVKYKMDQAP
ncbi:MAG: protein kinase domain-containing protein [Myxococcota bacterium]